MSVLLIAIPTALLLALISVVTFVLQIKSGQYDDLDTPALRMLLDESESSNQPELRSLKSQSQ